MNNSTFDSFEKLILKLFEVHEKIGAGHYTGIRDHNSSMNKTKA